MIEQLHFLRPWWFLALIPLCLMLLYFWKSKGVVSAWRAVCDAHLIPHILDQGPSTKVVRYGLLLAVAGILAIVALAGPAWQKLPQPLFKQQSALVVILDLSKSMDVTDVAPSRLERARLKLIDLLRLRKEGQTALVVYAGDAFVVTPLTDDTETITALAHSLSTDLMPLQGSQPERAIKHALMLLSQAGALNGSLLLITDGVHEDDVDELASVVVDAGYRLSVIGVGTTEGAPIPGSSGGFVKDSAGQIIVPKLDEANLQELASKGRGVYTRLSIEDMDIQQVLALTDVSILGADAKQTELATDRWREEGPWLLLLLLPIAAFAFRRGVLLVILVVGLHVSDPAVAFEWADLWLNANQKGAQAMRRQEYAQAANAFRDEQWKAAAYYRAGQYDQALTNLENAAGPDAAYNRGNALAKLGRILDAIESYEQALSEDPGHEDAKYNMELLKELQREQQQQSPSDPEQKSSSSEQEKKNDAQQSQQQNQPQQADGGQDQDERQDQSQSMNQNPSGEGSSSEPEQQQGRTKQANAEQQNQLKQSESTQPSEHQQAGQNQAQSTLDTEPYREEQQAMEQWLRRIPDDPGGLLRRKFRYQYSRRNQPVEPGTEQW